MSQSDLKFNVHKYRYLLSLFFLLSLGCFHSSEIKNKELKQILKNVYEKTPLADNHVIINQCDVRIERKSFTKEFVIDLEEFIPNSDGIKFQRLSNEKEIKNYEQIEISIHKNLAEVFRIRISNCLEEICYVKTKYEFEKVKNQWKIKRWINIAES